MISLMTSGGIALWAAALGTPLLIRWLARRRIGQQIREDGPFMHLAKAGTPTMGGLALVVAAAVGYLMGHAGTHVAFSRPGVLVIGVTLCAAAVGFLDDWIKVRHRRSLGLNKRAKLAAQVAIGIGFALLAEHWAGVNTHLSFTRWNSTGFDFSQVGWVVWAVVILVGTANAVNLTDGLDGLAGGCMIFTGSAFVALTYLAGHSVMAEYLHIPYFAGSGELAVVLGATVGAVMGFLWFNCYPAQVFMGDTGSLPLGGLVGLAALVTRQEVLLFIIGGIFVLETLSVIVQVAWFRRTGNRILACSPLHNHFLFRGQHEMKIVVRFWIGAALLAIVGVASLKIR